MQQLKVKIRGIAPHLMNSPHVTLNPLHPLGKEIKKYTGKRKKTDEDHHEISRLEWLARGFFDDKLGPYIPSEHIDAMIRGAAKLEKSGPKVQRGVMTVEEKIPLQYDGPRDPAKMFNGGNSQFVDIRPIKNRGGGGAVLRTRPIFREWGAEFSIAYDENMCDRTELTHWLQQAGRYIGLGDYRPKYGRFEVESVK